MMKLFAPLSRLRSFVAMFLLALLVISSPARAQSLLRDAETERFLHTIMQPIFEAAGLNPGSISFYLVNDPSINAFVAGGQNIFVHSGLILTADNVNELIGVLAHETGHIAGGHLIRSDDAISKVGNISLLSLLVGVAAMAAGGGDAGMAAMAAGQSMAQGNYLAYSRSVEAVTDQAGAEFMERAGISGKGLITFFRKLQEQEFRYGYTQDAYVRTHPLTGDRIEKLQERVAASPYYNKPMDPAQQAEFLRLKAKLAGFVNEPARTFQMYPETDKSVPARLARAYAWHKMAQREKAEAEVDALLAKAPDDPYFLEMKGQILLESGRVQEAIAPLRHSVKVAPKEPLIATTLGHALVSTEDPELAKEAITILRRVVTQDHENPFAWFQLGMAYARLGDEPRAALASAERLSLEYDANPAEVAYHARRAVAGLPKNTPEWLRAQDILLIATEAARNGEGKRRRRG